MKNSTMSGGNRVHSEDDDGRLVIPIVMWGPRAPTHRASVIHMMSDQQTLVTGSLDGQLILWDVDCLTSPKIEVVPRLMLLTGVTSAVKCIAETETNRIVTSSEDGDMMSWDVTDGNCIDSKKHPDLVHKTMKAYK